MEKELCGNEERVGSIKTGGFVCLSFFLLILSHCFWIPRNHERVQVGGVQLTAPGKVLGGQLTRERNGKEVK